MLLHIWIAVVVIGPMPSVYLIGQLTAVRAMARYYGNPKPTWTETIRLHADIRRKRRDARP